MTKVGGPQKICGPSANVAIWGFATCGLIFTNLRICDLWPGTPKKFVDLRLRNEPKNFLICDLRTNKKRSACPPLHNGAVGSVFSAYLHMVAYIYPVCIIHDVFLLYSGILMFI
jgi:hypothetical protein